MPIDETDRYYPFDAGDGQYVRESDWAAMAEEWQLSGVDGGPDGTDFKVSLPSGTGGPLDYTQSGSRVVRIAAGKGFVRGFIKRTTVTKDLTLDAEPGAPRWDVIVLRLNQTGNIVDFAINKGGWSGTGQVPQSPDEVSLGLVLVDQVAGIDRLRIFGASDVRTFLANYVPPLNKFSDLNWPRLPKGTLGVWDSPTGLKLMASDGTPAGVGLGWAEMPDVFANGMRPVQTYSVNFAAASVPSNVGRPAVAADGTGPTVTQAVGPVLATVAYPRVVNMDLNLSLFWSLATARAPVFATFLRYNGSAWSILNDTYKREMAPLPFTPNITGAASAGTAHTHPIAVLAQNPTQHYVQTFTDIVPAGSVGWRYAIQVFTVDGAQAPLILADDTVARPLSGHHAATVIPSG